jgi:hypothetical protein
MDLTEGSETSANHNLTPGKYTKEHIQTSKHGESLKSKTIARYGTQQNEINFIFAVTRTPNHTTLGSNFNFQSLENKLQHIVANFTH